MTKGGPNSAVELLEEMGFQCGREVGRCCMGKGGEEGVDFCLVVWFTGKVK